MHNALLIIQKNTLHVALVFLLCLVYIIRLMLHKPVLIHFKCVKGRYEFTRIVNAKNFPKRRKHISLAKDLTLTYNSTWWGERHMSKIIECFIV